MGSLTMHPNRARWVIASLVLPALIPLVSWGQAVPGVALTEYALVSSARVDRTRFDYTYRVLVRNGSSQFVANLTGSVTSSSSATTVVDGAVSWGDVPAVSSRSSTDTITIRQDRTMPFNAAVLQWRFAGAVVVDATPPPDPGALGDVTVGGVDSNSNGVRDDVERWILIQNQSPNIRNALFAQTRVFGAALEVADHDAAVELGTRLARVAECMYSLSPSSASTTLKSLLAVFHNTQDRSNAYIRFGDLLGGAHISLRRPADFSTSCQTS